MRIGTVTEYDAQIAVVVLRQAAALVREDDTERLTAEVRAALWKAASEFLEATGATIT